MILFSLVFPAFRFEKAEATQGNLFNEIPVYLLSKASDVAGYRAVSINKPTSQQIKMLSFAGSGNILIGSWISPAIPTLKMIEPEYNFLFAIYANTTGQTYMFGEFYLYRAGIETLIFRSMDSNNVTYLSACQHFWQDKTKLDIAIQVGDRIVFKLYFKATSGSHYFFFDCRTFPSYITDPTETRYLLKASWTQNGLSAKQLSLSSPSSTYESRSQLSGQIVSNASWGVRVYNRTSAGSETEITSGFPVALVNRTANGGYSAQSNTWSCPASNWNQASNCSLVIRWFCTFANNGTWYNLQNSTTEGLGSSFLNASTWTITYYTKLVSKESAVLCTASLAYDGIDDSLNYYPTRITNIVYTSADYVAPYYYNFVYDSTLSETYCRFYCNWTETGVEKSLLSKYRYGHNNSGTFSWSIWIIFDPIVTQNITFTFLNNETVGNKIAVKCEANDTSGNLNDTMPYQYYTITSSKSWHSIELFNFDILTRKWLPIESFIFDFLTRSWLSVSAWSFDLLTKGWNNIASWNLDLLTRSWSEVATFNLDLLTRSWLSISLWFFDLTYPMWHSVSLWSFQLTFGEDVSFLLIPLLFLFLLAGSVIILGISRKI